MKTPQCFTLNEAAVLTLVIMVSVIVALPLLNKHKEKSRRISCACNLKQISLALHQYAVDFSDHYPAGQKTSSQSLYLLFSGGYLTDPKLFICPASEKFPFNGKTFLSDNLSYAYISGIVESGGSATGSPDSGIVADSGIPSNHKNFGYILFQDGHVAGYTGANWADNANHQPGGWSSAVPPIVD